jgi:hypothetical protein
MTDTMTLTQDLTRARSLVTGLKKLSAPLHPSVEPALAFAAHQFHPELVVKSAQEALQAAETAEEVQEALAGIAASQPAFTAQETVRVALLIEQVNRLRSAIGAGHDEVFGFLVEKFEKPAEEFTKAAVQMPDLTAPGNQEFTRTEAESNAIRETKRLKAELDPIWSCYKRLCQMFDYISEGIHDAYALGEIQRNQQALNIEYMWTSAKMTTGKAWLPVFPYLAVVMQGARLRLDPDPAGIRDRRVALMEATGGSSPASAAVSAVPMLGNTIGV